MPPGAAELPIREAYDGKLIKHDRPAFDKGNIKAPDYRTCRYFMNAPWRPAPATGSQREVFPRVRTPIFECYTKLQ
jgi:hypothetical protein